MSAFERDNATNNLGYSAEGIACYIQPIQAAGTTPLYRSYQKASDDHFYTTNLAEHDNAVQNLGYKDEGVTGFVFVATGEGSRSIGWYLPNCRMAEEVAMEAHNGGATMEDNGGGGMGKMAFLTVSWVVRKRHWH
jgi:hypothetical protein